jgi:hypothetical protein
MNKKIQPEKKKWCRSCRRGKKGVGGCRRRGQEGVEGAILEGAKKV